MPKKQGDHKPTNKVMQAKARLVKKYDAAAARRNLENERECAYYAGRVSFDNATVARRKSMPKCVVFSYETGAETRTLVTRAVAYRRLHADSCVPFIWDAKEHVYVYYDAAKDYEFRLSQRHDASKPQAEKPVLSDAERTRIYIETGVVM